MKFDVPEQPDPPNHYGLTEIEAIDVIEDWGLDFCLGNVVKYLARYRHKGGMEDLQKARWYLERAISKGESV